MHLKDMMTGEFATLNPDDPLKKAISFLRNSQRDGLPVLHNNKTLAGIFTKTNLYDALLKGSNLKEPVSKYYTKKVVKLNWQLSYDEVIEAVRKIPVGTGVVVNDNDQVVGLFTKVELITSLFKEERLLNARLRAMYQAVHNAIISVDYQNRINFINRAAENLFALSFAQIDGNNLSTVIPGLDINRVLKKGCVEVGINYNFGDTRTVVNITPLFDGEKVIGAIAIFQDITELESIAEEMSTVKRLNQTLETVLDIGYDAMVVVNESGDIVLVNKVFLNFINKKEINVLSQPINAVLENSRLHIVVKTGIPELNDIQFIDGKPYVVSRLPIVKDGQIIGAVGKISFRRVDELRELASKLETMDNRLVHLREELKKERYRERPYCFEDIVSINPAMHSLLNEARKAAQGLSTVLITGESGVGKELMAQSIHQYSPRKNKPFIKVNCAAVPENLLESEFFGYAAGAFTGARQGGKRGRFELAHEGTLFLDEIGDMPLSLQGKILRVLQDHTFEKVGATATVHVDIRVIAATNHNLEKKVGEGSFRKDLFYRLNVIPIPIPPLRERSEDILPLIHTFLRKYNSIFGMEVTDIAHDALEMLMSYSWPGNIRELENMIERAMNFTTENVIRIEHLPPELREGGKQKNEYNKTFNREESRIIYKKKWEQIETEAINKALHNAQGNKSKAAKALGMSRSWFYEKMNRLGIKENKSKGENK